MVESYEIRYKLREKDDFLQRGKMLHQEYQDLLQENFKNSFAQKIVAQMFHRVEEEAILEAVEEVHEMHELAHRKTEDCFRSIFNEPDIAAKIE